MKTSDVSNVISELEDMWNNYWSSRATWEIKYCWLPRRCALSNKLIWLDLAYRGKLVITGPGEPVIEYRWHDVDEHLIWLIKN